MKREIMQTRCVACDRVVTLGTARAVMEQFEKGGPRYVFCRRHDHWGITQFENRPYRQHPTWRQLTHPDAPPAP